MRHAHHAEFQVGRMFRGVPHGNTSDRSRLNEVLDTTVQNDGE